MNIENIGIIGYGEVGETYATHFAEHGYRVRVTNTSPNELSGRINIRNLSVSNSIEDLSAKSDLIISCVVPHSAQVVARDSARALDEESLYIDLNSISPITTRKIETEVLESNAAFIKGVITGSVSRDGPDAPVLINGDSDTDVVEFFRDAGVNASQIGTSVEDPAVLRMSRSMVTKGLVCLLTESLILARQNGVETELIASLDETFDSITLGEYATYFIPDLDTHSTRRAKELGEVLRTLDHNERHSPMATQTKWMHDLVSDTEVDGETYVDVIDSLDPYYQTLLKPNYHHVNGLK